MARSSISSYLNPLTKINFGDTITLNQIKDKGFFLTLRLTLILDVVFA